MTRTVHMCISVKGALSQKKKLTCFTDDDGNPLTDKQVRGLLKLAEFEGKRVIPMGECDNFDYQTGCRGHVKGEITPNNLTDII